MIVTKIEFQQVQFQGCFVFLLIFPATVDFFIAIVQISKSIVKNSVGLISKQSDLIDSSQSNSFATLKRQTL